MLKKYGVFFRKGFWILGGSTKDKFVFGKKYIEKTESRSGRSLEATGELRDGVHEETEFFR